MSIEREFSELVQGRRVDMVTPKFLNARIREQVLSGVGKTAGLSRDAYDADENLRLALTHLVQICP